MRFVSGSRKKGWSRIVSVVLCCYLLVFLFPQLVFGTRLDYRGYRIYSHHPLDDRIYRLLDSAEQLVQASELYQQRPAQIRVFITSGFSEFAFFQPAAFAAFATTNPLNRHIVLSKTDIPANRIYAKGASNNQRQLSRTLAHEVTHVFLLEHLGLVRFLTLDRWKNEGYADHIAQESSFDYSEGIKNLCAGAPVSSASFDYFRYRLYVGYLLDHKKQSMSTVLSKEYSKAELDAAVQRQYCN